MFLSLQQTATGGAAEEKRKPRGEIIKYSSEFLMKFAEVSILGWCMVVVVRQE